jgi:S1-C subfamily serine protease
MKIRLLLRPVALLLTSVSTLAAASPPIPDFTQGGRPDETHDWNLGPTGARGWIAGRKLETIDSRQILITAVAPRSPAAGVLEKGDVILGVGGNPFESDARKSFGAAITQAETEAGAGNLDLLRWRAGKTETVTVRLPVLGSWQS